MVFCKYCIHNTSYEDECCNQATAIKAHNYYKEFYKYKKMSVLNKNNDCKNFVDYRIAKKRDDDVFRASINSPLIIILSMVFATIAAYIIYILV